jgi:ABC-2 type transport system ATP-binding protein
VDTALQTRGLRKRYTDARTDALVKVNLSVPSGARAAIVGPLDCGKSTLLRILAGRVRPTQGWVTVHGVDPFRKAGRLRRRLGWIPHEGAFPKGLTVAEVGDLVRRLSSCGDELRFMQLCTSFGLDPGLRADRAEPPARRRLHAALALQKNPSIVLVDSPTDTLDTGSEREYLRAVMAECQWETTVVASARALESVLGLVTEIFLLREGQIVDRCVPEDMTPRGEIGRSVLDSLPAALPQDDFTYPTVLYAVSHGTPERTEAEA